MAKINKNIEIKWGIPIPEKSADQVNPQKIKGIVANIEVRLENDVSMFNNIFRE
jgi:hypothetical protein